MKRISAIALLVFSVISLLLSCQRQDEEVVIEYWTYTDDKREELEVRLIEEFEREYPGIKVERRMFSSAELLDMIPSALEAGEGPVLFNLPSEEISSLLISGALEPVDSSILDISLFIEGSFEGVTLDGRIYGIPREYTNWCLYVNKAALDEAGLPLPRTWEDIVGIAESLSVHDGPILRNRVFDFRYPYYLTFFIPMVEQLGGSLVGPDGSFVYGDEAWIKALSFMQEWGPLGKNLGSPTLVNARTLFNTEDSLMCLSGLYQEERIKEQNPEFYGSERWAVLPFPVFEDSVADVSGLHYMHFFLVNAARSEREKEAGWLLASFFVDHADQYLEEVGLLIPLRDMIEGDKVQEKPFGDVFISDLGRSHAVYSGEHASEIQNLIGEAIENVMLRGMSPEQAVALLRASVNYLFAR